MEGKPISTDELRDSSTGAAAEVAEEPEPAATEQTGYLGSLAMSNRVERARAVIANEGTSMPIRIQGTAAEMHRYLRRFRGVSSTHTTRTV